ncbi:hypothetical protein [Leucobacter ruminantium]|uniref:Uncharacterized protein n=1 Tax=Leucobacter ruminantium TaxID=1289170 RepID=A0A939LVQ3_9MICO|nr:hypothetical protein [Leucobacter ruminantium]MBO1804048.1 hypothetical protein [Leucobacter ruminantium]
MSIPPPQQPGSPSPQQQPQQPPQTAYQQPQSPPGYAQPQGAQPQPPYQQPGYAQPYQQQPAQQPYQPVAPRQYAQQPSDRNVLALISLIITGAVAVIWSACLPLVFQAVYASAALTFSPVSLFFSQWIDVIVAVPLYLVALCLALVAVRQQARPRGRVLAFIAIGGASVGIVMTVLTNIVSNFAYRF